MPPRDRFVALNGLRLHQLEWGDPASQPVILLHGGSAHAHWWDVFATAIADAYHVLALDLRGHGDSQHPNPPAYRIDDYVGDVAAFIEAEGFQRVDLIGHSLGAMVATAYAGHEPQRLNSLSVIDSPLKITPGGAQYMTRLRNFPQPVYRDVEQATRRFRLLPVNTAADKEILHHIATHGIRQLPDGRWTFKFDREALAHHEPQDLTPILSRLHCPLLLVRGAHSTLLSHAALAALLAIAPHAQAAEIPDAHHHVMLDNPAAFERLVRGFLDGCRLQTAEQPRTLEPPNP